jgi:hypothetical protein
MLRDYLRSVCGICLVIAVSQLASADTLTWQGPGTAADIGSSNYFNVSTSTGGQAPGATDTLYIGATGTATYNLSNGTLPTGRLFVGHNITPNNGAGTVILTDGTIATSAGADGAASAGFVVGLATNGTVILNGGTITSLGIVVGYGSSGTPKGFLSIGTTAYVNSTGDLFVGSGTNNGLAGTLNTSGNGTIAGDMIIGQLKGSSYTQNNGSITVVGGITAGQSDTTATTFTMTSGTLTAASFTQSNGKAKFADTVNISGDAWLETTFGTSGHNFTIGSGTANVGTTFNLSGNATVKSGNRFLVGSSATAMNITNNIIVNQSGGTNTFVRNLSIADANGYATYNLSDGTLIGGNEISIVGRAGNGFLIQSGGTISINNGLNIGDRQNAANAGSLNNSGFYQLSNGTLIVTSTGLTVGPAGAGTFNIVGQDANISITGNFSVSATNSNAKGNSGTLLFTLQSGESLSTITATGNGTFGLGSHIVIDDAGNTPTQFVYDLVHALGTITDSGLTFQAPPNWTYGIISDGGTGQILQAYAPEPTSLGLVGLTMLAFSGRRRRRTA